MQKYTSQVKFPQICLVVLTNFESSLHNDSHEGVCAFLRTNASAFACLFHTVVRCTILSAVPSIHGVLEVSPPINIGASININQ